MCNKINVNEEMNESKVNIDKKIEENRMYTQEEVAYLLNCSTDRVTDWRNLGLLKATKTGKNYMIYGKTLIKFIEEFEGKNISNFNESQKFTKRI